MQYILPAHAGFLTNMKFANSFKKIYCTLLKYAYLCNPYQVGVLEQVKNNK